MKYRTLFGLLIAISITLLPSLTIAETVFPQGMVTLTFDDGWRSQYTNALPILKSANIPASFYIITNTLANGNSGDNENILCSDPANESCDGAQITVKTNSWTAANQYPDPSVPTYVFKETYTANATVTLTISYFNGNGRAISGQQNIVLATLPAGTSKAATVTFTIPSKVTRVANSFFTMKETVATGKTLSVTNPTLVRNSTLDTYMSTGDVLDLFSKGMEIGAHTMAHCDLVMLLNNPGSATTGGQDGPPTGACASAQPVPRTATDEINGSRTALLSLGFIPVDTFAYPYGSYNPTIEGLLKSAGFIGSRITAPGLNTKDSDPYALLMRPINQTVTGQPLSQVTGWIDTATTSKKWLILMFHNVEPLATLKSNGDSDGTTPEFLASIVNYLASKHVCVVTMHDGIAAMATTSSTNPCLK